ncbi:MAG TPA: ComF family protein, partial [Cellvibrionaceae bacterium]|nr:ComF family protein [Cellvibrionaceae bacterium]
LCDGASFTALCSACEQDLPRLQACCPQCALPLAHSEALCPDCLAQPKPFAHTYGAFAYVFPVDSLIQQFKTRAHWPVAAALGCELAAHINARAAAPYTALVPMPQHWRGLLARGRNPAAELATGLGRRLNTPVKPLLRKTRYTPAQKQLTRKERWQNLAGSLACSPLAGGRYLLVDDVMTTGASCILASQVLLDAGAQAVDVAVLARTPER